MSKLLVTALALGALPVVTGCSCAIFREGFAPVKRQRPLTAEAVRQVAMTNGFRERSAEHGAARFQNGDIEMLFHHAGQSVVVRSSHCPLFSNPFDPSDWQLRCESTSRRIAGDFKRTGIPVRKLSGEDAEGRD